MQRKNHSNNIDVSNDSSNSFGWKVAVFCAILGAIAGGAATFLGSYILEQHQQDIEQRAVAQAIVIDIHDTSQTLNNSLNNYYFYINESKNPYAAFVDPTPYYQNNGIYFAYLPSIYKFDPKTSEDIFMYYSNVMSLEQERQYIAGRNGDFFYGKNVSSVDNQTVYKYSTTMPIGIIFTISKGKEIEYDLEKKYNLNINLSRLDKIALA